MIPERRMSAVGATIEIPTPIANIIHSGFSVNDISVRRSFPMVRESGQKVMTVWEVYDQLPLIASHREACISTRVRKGRVGIHMAYILLIFICP